MMIAVIQRVLTALNRTLQEVRIVAVEGPQAADVIAADAEIDRMEMVIEEQAVHLLALQQPVAVDLRFLVAALKINNDLERIGDHAVNIAEGAERLAGQRPFKPFIDIPYMAEVAMSMDGVLRLYFGESNLPTPDYFLRFACHCSAYAIAPVPATS